jgi:hypothetical protein
MVSPYVNILLFRIRLCSSFLEGPKSAMLASKDFADGHYESTPQHGIRAFARVYSAWAYGQTVSYPVTSRGNVQIKQYFTVVPGAQVPDGRRVSHCRIMYPRASLHVFFGE